MARIAGVDLPRDKRLDIALTYIYGVGTTSAGKIVAGSGVEGGTKVRDLSEDEVLKIRAFIDQNLKVEGDLRREIAQNIKRKMEIGCYEGLRHRRGLPVRGQRTRTNARTRKGPKKTVAGKKVTTLEGLPAEERDLIARAFVTTGGLQCGFCIPGIAMRTKWMLDQNPAMPREEIARWLGPHLCRCTGYTRILDAVELAGKVRQGGKFPELDQSGKVGTSLAMYEGPDKVLGDKVLGDQAIERATQDFVMVNHPAFFIRDAAALVDFAKIVTTTWLRPRPKTSLRMLCSFGRLNSSPITNIRKTMPNSAR